LPGNAATGNGYAAFLLGFTGNMTLTKAAPFRMHNWAMAGYFQDDWKISPRLTLNLGVRYDVETGRASDNNMQSSFDLGQINPAAGVPGVRWFFSGADTIPSAAKRP
jgi:outer membrane receptor protein involved in Fe transport